MASAFTGRVHESEKNTHVIPLVISMVERQQKGQLTELEGTSMCQLVRQWALAEEMDNLRGEEDHSLSIAKDHKVSSGMKLTSEFFFDS